MQRQKIEAYRLTNDTGLILGCDAIVGAHHGLKVIVIRPVMIMQHDVTGEKFAIKSDEPLQMIVADHVVMMAKLGTFDVYDSPEEAQEAFDSDAEAHARRDEIRMASTGLSPSEDGAVASVPQVVGEDPGLDTRP